MKKAFIVSVCLILLATASAKLFTAVGHVPMLEQKDPVFFVLNRHLLIGVALIELVAMLLVVVLKNEIHRYAIIVLLGGNFMLYRAALAAAGGGASCPCLGNMVAWTHVNPNVVNFVLWGIAIYIFLGGCLALYMRNRQMRVKNYRAAPESISHVAT